MSEIVEGVYSKTSIITIGTASTAKKTKTTNYFYVKPLDNGKVAIHLLNIKNQPVGMIEELEIESFKKEYEYVSDLETFQKQQEKTDINKIKAEEHAKLGDKHLSNKEFLSAEFEYGTALKYDKNNLKANHGLSKLYLETGNIEKAKEYLQKLSNIDDLFSKENKHIFNEFAINLRKQKMYDEAIKNYQKAIMLDPEDEVLYYNLARAYYDKGEIDKAIQYMEQALKINPNFKEAEKALIFLKKKNKK